MGRPSCQAGARAGSHTAGWERCATAQRAASCRHLGIIRWRGGGERELIRLVEILPAAENSASGCQSGLTHPIHRGRQPPCGAAHSQLRRAGVQHGPPKWDARLDPVLGSHCSRGTGEPPLRLGADDTPILLSSPPNPCRPALSPGLLSPPGPAEQDKVAGSCVARSPEATPSSSRSRCAKEAMGPVLVLAREKEGEGR